MEPDESAKVIELMIEDTGDARSQFRRVGFLSYGLQYLQKASTDSDYNIDSKSVQVIVDDNGQKRFIIDVV
jgi:hypothetical protein